jgi:UDP-N-acetylglucosamine enolpyruvyl transferase
MGQNSREAGIAMTRNCKVVAAGLESRAKEVEIYTLPYPGFPTDFSKQKKSPFLNWTVPAFSYPRCS